MSDLQGKSIIVTGAAGGIGRAAALHFAAQGAILTLSDVSPGADVVDEVNAIGGQATFVQADISAENDVKKLVAASLSMAGRLDGAFNNAGVDQANCLLHELDVAEFDRVVAVNLRGVFLCMKHQIIAMLEGTGGSIVNTASILGQVALARNGSYTAAKHGVIGLTKTAAIETAKFGVRVNALLPGAVATPMFVEAEKDPAMAPILSQVKKSHPIGRMAEPREMADVAAWLLSDASSYVTGASITADGGFTAQ